MIIVNCEYVAGREISETLTVVKGSIVKARHIGRDIFAGLKNIVGGEISEYSKLLESAREEATKRMIKNAESIGADAVINVRYTTAAVMSGCSEILVYGTAVKLK